MINSTNFGFYTIDSDYLEYLSEIDQEVYFNSSYGYSTKPFVGIIVGIKQFKYFIPLTSAKEKHKIWKNVTDEHFLVYEIIDNDITFTGDIYKYFSDTKKMHVLAVLDIKKMIPVPDGCYKKIEFNKLTDSRYKDLFEKEYAFCLSIKPKILKKVEKLYCRQKETGKVRRANCDFAKLEHAMKLWIQNNIC